MAFTDLTNKETYLILNDVDIFFLEEKCLACVQWLKQFK